MFKNYQYIEVEPSKLKTYLQKLSNQFKTLSDCFATNYKSTSNSDQVIHYLVIYYQLSDYKLSIFVFTKLDNNEIDSITDIFPNANWYEREIFEKFGVKFFKHPNLVPLMSSCV